MYSAASRLRYSPSSLFGAIDPFRHDTSAEIVFDGPVSGLAVGAPVTFRGVPVGHVTSIRIDYDPQTPPGRGDPGTSIEPGTTRCNSSGRSAQSVAGPITVRHGSATCWRAQTGASEPDLRSDRGRSLTFDSSDPPRLHPDIAALPGGVDSGGRGRDRLRSNSPSCPLQQLADQCVSLCCGACDSCPDSLNGSPPPLLGKAPHAARNRGRPGFRYGAGVTAPAATPRGCDAQR